MRYFASLAYNGAAYFGWQRQPQQISVQQALEEAMSLILNTPIAVVGCGRTDARVHASQYYVHFDFDGDFPHTFIYRLNKVLPSDIVVYQIWECPPDAHARFGAYQRSYEYHIDLQKNPFQPQTIFHYPYTTLPDLSLMGQAAQLLLEYQEFAPFCKANHDAKTLICVLQRSEWELRNSHHWVFHITSNRFLRGMVRLIVGMCLNVGRGRVVLEQVQGALDQQKALPQSWSVPPNGLFLTEVLYPQSTFGKAID